MRDDDSEESETLSQGTKPAQLGEMNSEVDLNVLTNTDT